MNPEIDGGVVFEDFDDIHDDVFDEGDFIAVTPPNTDEAVSLTQERMRQMERVFFSTAPSVRNINDWIITPVPMSGRAPQPDTPRHLNRDMRQEQHKPAKDKKKVCEVIIDDILDI